ncbi:fungal-specific transcription factor domain-containing protein [Fusarium oxysporum Fo47]|nr:fungal-specific transcription factor domain-containing protein [Fusarium oxysporum Fo47]WJG37319.1 fungal-specific transcription factor domain-domain-containing protein [Fusarium oxysporum Fo47]
MLKRPDQSERCLATRQLGNRRCFAHPVQQPTLSNINKPSRQRTSWERIRITLLPNISHERLSIFPVLQPAFLIRLSRMPEMRNMVQSREEGVLIEVGDRKVSHLTVSESVDDTTPVSWPSSIYSDISLNSDNRAHEIHNTLDLPLRATPEQSLFGDTFRETLNVNLHGEEDLRFLMTYKDYVFPLLHPFYHTSFFEGGHNWLLVAAFGNPESRQLIVTLVTYFFSVVPLVPGAGYTLCSTFAWEQVQKQSEQAFKGMQHRVEMLGATANLWERTHLFGDIMLLLELETMTQYSQAWRPHLDAAIILFKKILDSPELRHVVWRVTFDPTEMSADQANRIDCSGVNLFSSTQVALRFFAAKIILGDIVSSSALEQVPRLNDYYEKLMSGQGEASLNMKDVTGCENWVFLSIADTVALDAWKKETKMNGNFSFMTLVQCAGKVLEKLDRVLAMLNAEESRAQNAHHQQGEIFAELTLLRSMRPPQDAYYTITRIWATAARLYLIVVLLGWSPGTSDVGELVSDNLKLLQDLNKPSWLMPLARPFCVTGCLVSESQELVVESIFDRTKPLSNVGGLTEAMKIVRETWKRRGVLNQEWDMAACFRSLDDIPLLV